MARQFTKPLDLYNEQKAQFAAVISDARTMHRSLAVEGEKDWKQLLSGTIKSRTLRALGHPFGRGASAATSTPSGRMRGAPKHKLAKHGIKGSVPLLPINKQRASGGLYDSVRIAQLGTRPQQFSVGIEGDADGAINVLAPAGTKTMVARGFDREVERRWRARNKALLDTLRERQRRP